MRIIGSITLFTLLFASCSSKKLIVTPVNSDRGDAVYSRSVPDNNYGQIEDIHIYCWTNRSRVNVNRVLIDFNLDEIPSSAVVDSAFLSLYYNPTSTYDNERGNKGEDNIIIQRVISNWHEDEVTWNTQPRATETNQIVLPKQKDVRADYVNIDMTTLIQDIVNEDEDRYGIMVRHQNERPFNVVYLASSNHSNEQLHPKLRVYYSKN